MNSSPGATRSVISVRNLSVHFGGLRAVDDVSFEVAEGEIMGLIGPNGAGKSTLFAAISGGQALTAGSVSLRDTDISGKVAHVVSHLGISRTFQKVRLFHSMSAVENVAVAASSRGLNMRDSLRVAQEALESCYFSMPTKQPVAGLGLADRKRVEIARALAAGPSVLLLDEMMNGLTPSETERIVELVRGLPERGITVILVEHVLPVVRALCARILVLNHGKLIADGPPDDVLSIDEVRNAYLGRSTGRG